MKYYCVAIGDYEKIVDITLQIYEEFSPCLCFPRL